MTQWGYPYVTPGEYIVHMLKKYGEEHFSVAQYGIIAITNLTSSAEIRHLLGALNACPVIVQMLRQHAFVMVDNGKGVMEAPVAVYGLYAIGKLSLNHDQNRQRFGTCGGCEEVVTVLERLGADNHTVTDYGMYALAHLAYFNLENKKRLSNVETYKVLSAATIMEAAQSALDAPFACAPPVTFAVPCVIAGDHVAAAAARAVAHLHRQLRAYRGVQPDPHRGLEGQVRRAR